MSQANTAPMILQQPRSFSVFDEEDAPELFKVEPNHPTNCIFTLHNKTRTSSIIFVGAFFQFTQRDREAWNEMITGGDIPDPRQQLGAEWARTTKALDDDYYHDHMPTSRFKIKDQKPVYDPGCHPPHYYFDDPEPA